MNKGFTLIELIGTVVILAVISLIAFPAILNMLNNSNNAVEEKTQEVIKSAALDYLHDHKDDNISSISVEDLMGKYISSSMVCDNCEIYNDTISVSKDGTLIYNEVGGEDDSCPTECGSKDLP